jgi:hypothetical protein
MAEDAVRIDLTGLSSPQEVIVVDDDPPPAPGDSKVQDDNPDQGRLEEVPETPQDSPRDDAPPQKPNDSKGQDDNSGQGGLEGSKAQDDGSGQGGIETLPETFRHDDPQAQPKQDQKQVDEKGKETSRRSLRTTWARLVRTEQSNGESRSSGIGEGPKVKVNRTSKKDGSSGGSTEMNPLVILVVSIVANDWLPKKNLKGNEDMNARDNYPKCVEAPREKGFVFDGRVPKNQNLDDLLAAPPVDESVLRVLIITAHTSYTQDGPLKEYLSLSVKGVLSMITFEAVVESLDKEQKFDLIILACCQGHKLAKMILEKGLVNKCIVFFGSDGECKEDGVHAFVAQDLVEKGLEMFSDAVLRGETNLSAEEMMKKLYITLGEEYVYPEALKLSKTPGGDYESAEYYLKESMMDTEGRPGYVKDHMFGGNLRIFNWKGDDLVTEELKEKREVFMAQKKAEVEMEYAQNVTKRARGE